MKILKVIHGYPAHYSAGSEIYSQTLCHELVKQGHDVVVFTRQENAYKQEYSVERQLDPFCSDIRIYVINMAHCRDGYKHPSVDYQFENLLDKYKPDIVHIGHLNHLSTSIVLQANKKNLPILFTLHDFWLMCPRGQFLQSTNTKTEDLYPICHFQEDRKCARHCYGRYFSSQNDEKDLQYWTEWVSKRMYHIKEEIMPKIDLFIAPSIYLMKRFIDDFSMDSSKIVYLDYGFQRKNLKKRKRHKENVFTFGYIGTHKQAKGIFHLIQAFSRTYTHSQLKIWGSAVEPFTSSLKSCVSTLPTEAEKKIQWMGSYKNDQIIEQVFNYVDAVVIPSIWGENSPLVIHEALEAKVPVITANFGGMKEYIKHEVNGLLFEHRNPLSLAEQMNRLVKEPGLLNTIAERGYLQSHDGHIPGIEEHVRQIESYYYLAIQRRGKRTYAEKKIRTLAHHI